MKNKSETPPIEFTWNGRECIVMHVYETMYLCREKNKLHAGTSDSVIVRGIVEVLIQYYDQETPEDIQAADEPEFIQALGLRANMPQTRSKGLDSIIKHIKKIAAE